MKKNIIIAILLGGVCSLTRTNYALRHEHKQALGVIDGQAKEIASWHNGYNVLELSFNSLMNTNYSWNAGYSCGVRDGLESVHEFIVENRNDLEDSRHGHHHQ